MVMMLVVMLFILVIIMTDGLYNNADNDGDAAGGSRQIHYSFSDTLFI